MKDVSYITVSRNDNYDANNLEKIVLTINNNVMPFVSSGLDTEVILIDWCSEKPFYLEECIKQIKFPMTHYWVQPSLLEADELSPKTYYEYFAKNVGLRRAQGKYVLVENMDCLNDEDLSKNIVEWMRSGQTGVYGRPTLRINALYPNYTEYTHYDTIDDKPLGDLNPGDIIMAAKEDFLKVGGYDETNPIHRKGSQTHMDVEILYQFNYRGILVKFLPGYYSHLDHNKPDTKYDSMRNTNLYNNRPHWGYIKAKEEKLANNVIRLYA